MLGVVTLTFNPITPEAVAEAGRWLWARGQYGWYSELQDSQGCVERPYLKTNQRNKNRKLKLERNTGEINRIYRSWAANMQRYLQSQQQ